MPPRPCHCQLGHGFFAGQVPDNGLCPIDGTPITCTDQLPFVCEAEHRFAEAQVPANQRCPIDGSAIRPG